MANLNQREFTRAVELLAEDLGLQRLRDRLVHRNALVTRRRVNSAQQLADQLYLLTGGLRRQVPATVALHGIWSEQMQAKLGEEGEKPLEELADKINACLGERDRIVEGKESELEDLLRQYEERLARAVGSERARIDMLLKAVPDVAERLRGSPPAEPAATGEPESE